MLVTRRTRVWGTLRSCWSHEGPEYGGTLRSCWSHEGPGYGGMLGSCWSHEGAGYRIALGNDGQMKYQGTGVHWDHTGHTKDHGTGVPWGHADHMGTINGNSLLVQLPQVTRKRPSDGNYLPQSPPSQFPNQLGNLCSGRQRCDLRDEGTMEFFNDGEGELSSAEEMKIDLLK
ncbi:hypothetical protein NDU88_007416 [Pleurodeles waltl]|uniref:Uncharacterized protein n=1 Tax=Pleurodeles waltl TaxID=8319 RepID=A0AAV7MF45_PLEWA|nr:hypothetical protein NDU88_007416 [Pleurodeles waltl]